MDGKLYLVLLLPISMASTEIANGIAVSLSELNST